MGDLFGQDRLPVISLWQPWASLIFTGDKKHETRAYRPPAKYIGQRIAIHAAKKVVQPLTLGMELICEREFGSRGVWGLPRGMILGTVRLVQAYETDEPFVNTDQIDRICGDWSPGRFAWLLKDTERLATPLPTKGKQGWWSIESSVIAEAA